MYYDIDLINIVVVGFGFVFIFGVLVNKLCLFLLVGYLVVGICVGLFIFGFVVDQVLVNQFVEIGVMLLMFGVGLYFLFKDFMVVKVIVILGVIGQILVVMLLGWGLVLLMGWLVIYGVVFGFLLVIVSMVVLLCVMEECCLLEIQCGKIVVGWLIVEDFVCVLVLVMMLVLVGVFGLDVVNEMYIFGSVLVSIGWIFVQLGLFVVVMFVVGCWLILWIFECIVGIGLCELFILLVLVIVFGVVFGLVMLFGVLFVFGVFFVGMLFNEFEFSYKVVNDFLLLCDVFVVLFFVLVGMLFNLVILIEYLWQVLVIVVIIMFGKFVVVFVIVCVFGYFIGIVLIILVSLVQIGEFVFIIVGFGVVLKILLFIGQVLVLVGVLILIMFNLLVFGLFDCWLFKYQEVILIVVEIELLLGLLLDLYDYVIVIGYGWVGSVLVQVLCDCGVLVMIIDDNKEYVVEVYVVGLFGICGSVVLDWVLVEVYLECVKIVVLVILQFLEVGEMLVKLWVFNLDLILLVWVYSDVEVKYLLDYGVDGIVMVECELVYLLVEMVMFILLYCSLGKYSILVVQLFVGLVQWYVDVCVQDCFGYVFWVVQVVVVEGCVVQCVFVVGQLLVQQCVGGCFQFCIVVYVVQYCMVVVVQCQCMQWCGQFFWCVFEVYVVVEQVGVGRNVVMVVECDFYQLLQLCGQFLFCCLGVDCVEGLVQIIECILCVQCYYVEWFQCGYCDLQWYGFCCMVVGGQQQCVLLMFVQGGVIMQCVWCGV